MSHFNRMTIHRGDTQPRSNRRMPRGFHLLIAAQFASGLADNALLIVAIALLQRQGHPAWWAPMLKFNFTLAYVVLAPFIGPLADSMRKARLMSAMNALKVAGVLLLAAGGHPLLAFALVGVGAATYAPAKYGLVTELVGPGRLVAANGWIEVSMVCAALLGTVFGGLLVGWIPEQALPVLLIVYGTSALLTLGVPDSGARYAKADLAPVRCFVQANRQLWRDREGGLSLAVTTLFWGASATLQIAVLRWAEQVLGLMLDKAAFLQAAVALGVIGGAALAGRWFSLHTATRVLPAGVLLGLLVPVAALSTTLAQALPMLMLVGAVGGLLVVPMNALLQHRGHCLLTAGRSIAVQGFNENLSILLMLGSYAALLALEPSMVVLMTALGLFVATIMLLLIWRERSRDLLQPLQDQA
jgi:MFS family permease